MVDCIQVKPERAWKGILDTKKQSLAAFIFMNGLCLLEACCGSFKRGFPDSAVAENLCHFEMLPFWAVWPTHPPALAGDRAFGWGL